MIQRQGLLQWGWDSSEIYTPEKVQKNAQRLAKITSSTLDSMANEKYFDSKINQWWNTPRITKDPREYDAYLFFMYLTNAVYIFFNLK
jgi:hypothetical protein